MLRLDLGPARSNSDIWNENEFRGQKQLDRLMANMPVVPSCNSAISQDWSISHNALHLSQRQRQQGLRSASQVHTCELGIEKLCLNLKTGAALLVQPKALHCTECPECLFIL